MPWPASQHQFWRQRRNARYNIPAASAKRKGTTVTRAYEQEQFLGPVLASVSKPAATPAASPSSLQSITGGAAPASAVVSIGNRQRAALTRFWEEKLKRARSQVVKDRYQRYLDVIRKRQRPSWDQSEKDLQHIFQRMGIPGQRTFRGGRQVSWVRKPGGGAVPPAGSVIPDMNPADSMIEVKNYNIQNQASLIRDLKRQIDRRRIQGPRDTAGNVLPQHVVLDMRGQQASMPQLQQLANRVATQTGLPAQNVQVVTWEL